MTSPSSTEPRAADARAHPLTPPAPPAAGAPARRRPRALSVASNSSTSTAAAAEEQAVGAEADAAASLLPGDLKLYRLPSGAMRRAPQSREGSTAGSEALQQLLLRAGSMTGPNAAAIAAAYSRQAARPRAGRQRGAAAEAPFLRLAHPNAFMWSTAYAPARVAGADAEQAGRGEDEDEDEAVEAVEAERRGEGHLAPRAGPPSLDSLTSAMGTSGGSEDAVEASVGAEGEEGAAPLVESPRKRRRTRADSMSPVSYSMLVEHAQAATFEGATDEPATFVGMGAEL